MQRLHNVIIKPVCVLLSLVLVIAFTAFLAACGDGGENQVEGVYNVGTTDDGQTDEENPSPVSGLVISKSEITTTAKFYGIYLTDGTYMEVVAVKYNGEYRTAFNTCQVCYYSPLGYFKQSGNYLVCQNCKNKFSMAQVGVTLGGCAPYPIFASDRADTDDSIIIPDSFLISCEKIFANWTGGY